MENKTIFYLSLLAGSVLASGAVLSARLLGKSVLPQTVKPTQQPQSDPTSPSTSSVLRGSERVALIGDSIGVGISRYLQEGIADFTSYAVVGMNTTGMLAVARREIRPGRYTTIIVEGHLNDGLRSAMTSISSLRDIYGLARSSGARIVAVGMTPWRGYRGWTRDASIVRDQTNAWILGGADGLVDVVIDPRPAVSDVADPSRLRREFASPDGLHLNASGYRAMANYVQSRIL